MINTPLSYTSLAVVHQAFNTNDLIRVRATRGTCSERLNGKIGYITGEIVIIANWDIAYEVALDNGGVIWLTEEELMPRRKAR